MKKNIVIILLLLISSFLFVFAFIKANDASRVSIMANHAMEEAVAQRQKAEKNAEQALKAQAEALRQKELADRAVLELQECLTK